MNNPLIDLETYGQSIWLDYISRSLLQNGDLLRLIKEDHLKGVTSNPSIFEKAIGSTSDYDDRIASIYEKNENSPKNIYELLAIKDIKDACDLLFPVYKKLEGADGFASLEVSPDLAFDTEGTIEEGLRLWQDVNRPNLMIKVPGTKEGFKAIRSLISMGINVNVTLLFSVSAYEEAANAYLLGLKDRDEKKLPIDNVHSVASFFVSRIDTKVDALLEKSSHHDAKNLIGSIAIANAKVAYLRYRELYRSELAASLLKKGAHPQRLLWASTSTKNPRYRDVLYVESLIGKDTVNTVPLETLTAFRDHGLAASTLQSNLEEAALLMDRLSKFGINFDSVCEELLSEGLVLFSEAFKKLLASVEKKITLEARR